MSDHLDAPGLNSPLMDAKTDITDVYAFTKPDDEEPGKSILILNVNPLTLADAFDEKALYQLNVDTNGDAVADRTFQVTFSPKVNGAQTATVQLVMGSRATTIFQSAPVSFGASPQVTVEGPYKLFAGRRSDPFFFDLLGFLSFVGGHGFDFTHGDFFAEKNVFGIVLEVPNRAGLGTNPQVGVWGRTRLPQNGSFIPDDRMGRPAINTVFNHSVDKNKFNNIEPSDDTTATLMTDPSKTYLQSFVETIKALSALGATIGGKGAYDLATATAIADILLPDILTYNYSNTGGFLNGRKLTDDVINAELGLLTNGSTLTDDASAHTDLLPRFPYLGTPH